MRKRRKFIWRVVLGSCLTAMAALVITVSARKPSLERNWDEDVRVLAGVEIRDDGSIVMENIRNWTYSIGTIASKEYFNRTYLPADIEAMWMYEQELDGAGLIAHTFVVFQFSEDYGSDRFLGLSVETRREVGEEYSILGGALRAFEITHIWATEEDLVRRRVQYLDYPLTRYKLELPEEYLPLVFRKFAAETADLAVTPQWYNTVENNCTSSLVSYVNESEPGAIPSHYSYVLTGEMDDYLSSLGYLDEASALKVTREYLQTNAITH
jgi:Domain of unknown function (DUF4105)